MTIGRRLVVPFISQMEDDNRGYNNCGPAAGAMLAAYNRVLEPTRESMHRFADRMRDGIYDGDWDAGLFTDYPQIISELGREPYGLSCKRITTWEGVFDTIDHGQPVIILLYNDYLEPRQYPAGAGWAANHFIVLTGYDEVNFYVNDPLAWPVKQASHYDGRSVRRAVSAIGMVYAMAVDAPEPELPVPPAPEPPPDPPGSLPPPPWDGLWKDLAAQNEALKEELAVRTTERDEARQSVTGWMGESAYNERKMLTLMDYLYSLERAKRVKKGTTDKLLASVTRDL